MDRPILFSAPMVRAILAGTKTQTRRAVRTQPGGMLLSLLERPIRRDSDPAVLRAWFQAGPDDRSSVEVTCPYGKTGDRLWVRETWQAFEHGMDVYPYIPKYRPSGAGLLYAASDCDSMGWRPSIHMPRWASRITLNVTGVRVERLQDISEADAQAEGCALECMTPTGDDSGSAIHGPGGFLALWSSINGAESWDANPWVWVVEFARVEG